ncbi:MAG TPA: hypothetical protein VH277_03005 [Gemmatimonadaceae bacterium]|nr:hypothetical protein [Gemmatimonadaceae bacterium]
MSRTVELSPILLLAAASTMLGLSTTCGSSAPDAELMLHEVGQPLGPRWDTAFIHHAGYWSHYEHDACRSAWPLPPTNDCNDWARFADLHGALSSGPPRSGDVFLLWSNRHKRFVHVGIVASYRHATGILPNGKSYMECETIEGNVDPAGRWHRGGIHRCTRRIVAEKGDRLIRWTELGEQIRWAAVAAPAELCRSLMLREMHARNCKNADRAA